MNTELASLLIALAAPPGDLDFRHHAIGPGIHGAIATGGGEFAERTIRDRRLGGHELQAADVDGDGDIGIVSKSGDTQPRNGAGGAMHVNFLKNLQR